MASGVAVVLAAAQVLAVVAANNRHIPRTRADRMELAAASGVPASSRPHIHRIVSDPAERMQVGIDLRQTCDC